MLRQTIAVVLQKGSDKRWLTLTQPLNFQKKMAKDKIMMPSSGAGITRYFEEYHSKLRFKPGHVIVICIVVIIITLLLHIYGKAMLG